MKKGEKVIFGGVGILIAGAVLYNIVVPKTDTQGDTEIPFYSTADNQLQKAGSRLLKDLGCRDCHSIWTVRSVMQSVPAPALDGLGSLYSEQWFYEYFSAEDPQSIVPSRLKQQYRMPSYAHLSEEERRTLAAYMASLKVEEWYLEDTRKREHEKLTGRSGPGEPGGS